MNADRHLIRDPAALRALYGEPAPASLAKEVDHIHPHYRAFIEAAPFAILATCSPEGIDASPRGDPAGFVAVEDAHTLLLPDRRGNNRVDSLANILADPRIALLFLIPGIGETLRVNGRADISVDPALLERFTVDGKPPRSVLVVHVETVYFQCSRAVVRARLWDAATQVPRSRLPSTGAMLAALSRNAIDGAAYDRALPERVAATLY
ncbi:MAG: pyridoxamine 5'-phosphate oxidase family protein [Burkholderiales bacterium]|nr:pyridoxamine 5'-phosphate oxidase family protein [Burkholderiales bacterium]